ncbi:SMP-30/gluconolactonase/LRE family protein [Litoribrevibacter euphylliae]|uniref:SMP-30/gluconolactonase/LRE family protein n=1 Tax=Litoribrevibacter euphylliae TaxID=1834034 RepID=A0ABV7H6U2_9GAMM
MKKLAVLLTLIFVGLLSIWLRYTESEHYPDLSSEPLLDESSLELVASLDTPPGNISVTSQGRIFLSLHPDAHPDMNVVEWVNGEAKAFPDPSWQPGGAQEFAFQQVLSIRVDQQDRLWVLDNGVHGVGQPRLLAFDINTKALVHQYDFDSDVFGVGSHANDFQVSADGYYIYITDASIFAKTPALVFYNVDRKEARRVLENDISVRAGAYEPIVQGREMTIAGLFTINPGVDGIALSRDGETLYYASVSGDFLYSIPTRHLKYGKANDKILASFIEAVGRKTMTDGMSTDAAGGIYLTDIEHSAIIRMDAEGHRQTLLKTDLLRWPDGLSFGPDGYLYITCSALHQVLGKLPSDIAQNAPYQVYRVKLDAVGVAGH